MTKRDDKRKNSKKERKKTAALKKLSNESENRDNVVNSGYQSSLWGTIAREVMSFLRVSYRAETKTSAGNCNFLFSAALFFVILAAVILREVSGTHAVVVILAFPTSVGGSIAIARWQLATERLIRKSK